MSSTPATVAKNWPMPTPTHAVCWKRRWSRIWAQSIIRLFIVTPHRLANIDCAFCHGRRQGPICSFLTLHSPARHDSVSGPSPALAVWWTTRGHQRAALPESETRAVPFIKHPNYASWSWFEIALLPLIAGRPGDGVDLFASVLNAAFCGGGSRVREYRRLVLGERVTATLDPNPVPALMARLPDG